MRRRHFAVLAAVASTGLAYSAHANDFVWQSFAGGVYSWTDIANWNPSGAPGVTNTDGTDTANTSVDMLGPLNVILPTGTYAINRLNLGITTTPNATDIGNGNSGGGQLAFTISSGTATINSNGALGSTNTISAPIALKSSSFLAIGSTSLNITGDLTVFGGNRNFDYQVAPNATTVGTVTLNNVFLSEPGATAARAGTFEAGNTAGQFNKLEITGVVSDGGFAGSQVTYKGKSGATIFLDSANTNTGTTTVEGNVVIRNDQAFGLGTVAFASISADISADGGARTIPNFFSLGSGVGTFSGSNDITLTGPVVFNKKGIQNNLASGNTLTFAGPVSQVGANLATFTTGSNGFAAGNLTFTGGLFNNTTVPNPGIASISIIGGTGLIRMASANNMSGNATFGGGNVRLDTPAALGTAANITAVTATTTLDFNGNSPTAGKHILLGNSANTNKASFLNNLAGTTVTLTNGISVTATTATASPIFYTSVPTFQVTNNPSDTTGTGASVSVSGLAIGSISVGGTGFTSLPTATVSGGGGTGGVVKINSMKLTNIAINTQGSGYTAAPTVKFSGGGGGTGAAATVTMAVNTATASIGGSGYAVNDALTFTGGTTGTPATGHVASVDESGAITSVIIDTPGNGYTTLPTIGVTSATGSGAALASDLRLDAITNSSNGSGYTTLPTVSLSGGGGTGGTLSSPLLAMTGSGVSVTNFGHGYTSLPTVTVSGGGSTGTVTVTNLAIDQQDVSMTPGSGYTAAPTVTVSTDGGLTFASNPSVLADWGQIIVNNGNSQFGGAGNMVINEVISDGSTGHGLTKIGTGTVTFNGANTYAGTTTVQAGALEIGTADTNQIISVSTGVDIQGGKLILDYTGSTIAPSIRTLLQTGYHLPSSFSSGQIRSTNATALIGLGYADNGTNQVSVVRTYYGDADLNGQVNITDFNALAANYGNTTTGIWATGDFNYDGVVNALDLNAIATNFGATPLLSSALPGQALGALVPEPASLGVLVAVAALGMRRRRSAR
jgi:autotransporter-associated beta strand protein